MNQLVFQTVEGEQVLYVKLSQWNLFGFSSFISGNDCCLFSGQFGWWQGSTHRVQPREVEVSTIESDISVHKGSVRNHPLILM